MDNKIDSEFDKQEGILRLKVRSYDDVVENGELTGEFLGGLLDAYKEIEETERKKHRGNLATLQKLRETIRKHKREFELPVRQIHVLPRIAVDMQSEQIRDAAIRSIGVEAEVSRTMADRWELFEDLAVGADLLIDVSAMTTGLIRYISTGEVKEGIAGFGYLAIVGMALLVAYFILRIFGEEPCKRRVKHLTHILGTPVTLHRRIGPKAELTFYPSSEDVPPDHSEPPQ